MTPEPLTISCSDDFPLSATLFKPESVRAAVMIAPATGIKKTFYHNLASFLADQGYGVICFENRGIGKSRQGNINAGEASLITWGQRDMPAVLEALKTHFPATTYHLIGHSAGGQLIGLMDNARDITSVFNVACSSGSLKNPPTFKYRLLSQFYMNFFIPVNNLLFGKTNSQWVGMGEPLPKKVAAQWREWCNGTGYVAVALGKEIKEHLYDDLSFPSEWVYATDDYIANLKNVKEMIAVFPKIEAKITPLDPQELGRKEIGHMKYFSSRNQDLWQIAVDWLEGQMDE